MDLTFKLSKIELSFQSIPTSSLDMVVNTHCKIVIPIINSVTPVKVKKAGVGSRNIVMKKQYTLF